MFAKRITKNFAFLFSGNVVSQLIVLYGFITIAGFLSPDDFGRFTFAQVIATFFLRFTEFGLETVSIRRITQHDHDAHIADHVFVTRIMLSFLVIAIALAWSSLAPASHDMYIIVIMLVSLIGISLTVEWFYQAKERMDTVAIIRTVRALLFVLPLFVIPSSYHTDEVIAWMYTVSFLLASAFFFVPYAMRFGFSVRHISMNTLMSLLREAAPVGAAILLMQVQYNYITFILGITMSKADVGAYSAAYRPVLAFWSFGVIAAYQAFFPVINSIAGDREAFRRFTGRLTRYFMTIGILLVVMLEPWSKEIIYMLYGPKYAGTEYIFEYSLVIILIVISRAVIEFSLVSLKMQVQYLHGMLLVSALYILFCSFGAITIGIVGAIGGAIVAELIYTAYLLIQLRHYGIWKEYIVFFMKTIAIGTATLGSLLVLSSVPLGIASVIMIVMAVAGLWMTKMISSDDFTTLWNIFSARERLQ